MSTRAERRRQAREEKASAVKYELTLPQLQAMVDAQVAEKLEKIRREVKKEAMDDACNTALRLLLILPLLVMMDKYWPKSYEKKLPGFANDLVDYYTKWQNGELDLDKAAEVVWVYGGVGFKEE